MNAGCIEPRFLEGRRSLERENRAPIQTARKAGRIQYLRSLASIRFELHRFSSTVQLSELVYVFLRL